MVEARDAAQCKNTADRLAQAAKAA
jgi:hypothetical protein